MLKKKKERERGYWEFPEAPGGFPGGTSGKESVCNAGDAENAGWIPRWRRSLGVENANPLKNCCLKNPTDRGI